MEPDTSRRLSKKELGFVAGLLVSNVIANYQFKALITVLTDEWGLKLFYAVILTNIQEGMKAVLVILVAALTDTCLSDCLTLFLSAIVYTTGLLIWYFTLHKLRENTAPGIFFYLALVLITAGQCGGDKYTARYIGYQKEGEHKQIHETVVNYDEEKQVISERENKALTSKDEGKRSRLLFYIRKVFTRIWVEIKCYWIMIVGLPIAIFAIPTDGSESYILAIILSSTAALFFIGKMCLYPFKRPQKSSLVEVFRVLLVALRKWHNETCGTCRYYGDAESATEDDFISQVSELENIFEDIYSDLQDDMEDNFELEGVNHVNHEVVIEESFALESNNQIDLPICIKETSESENNNHVNPEESIKDIHDFDNDVKIEGNSESKNNNYVNPTENIKVIYEPEKDHHVIHEVNIEDSDEPETGSHVDDEVNIQDSDEPETENHVDDEVNMEDSDEPETEKHVDDEVNIEDSDEPENKNHVDHGVNIEDNEPELTDVEDKLGFLDKAALYNPSTENPSTEFENRRLCTVKQVDDAKRFFSAIRLSAVFLMYGLLTAVGDTFFLDQANNMNTFINSTDVPIQVIAYIPSIVKYLISWLCRWVVAKQVKAKYNPFNGALRVGLGMLLAIPCFLTAFLVETKRVKYANQDTVLSVFWLTPQLFLIGAMNGLAVVGIEDFFEHEMPEKISRSYGSFLAEGVVGVGQLVGCLWFALGYLVTSFHGSTSWFADDVDKRHLDRYYAVMAVVSLVCFIIYVVVVARRSRSHSQVIPGTSTPS